jgi:hypothetical protein
VLSAQFHLYKMLTGVNAVYCDLLPNTLLYYCAPQDQGVFYIPSSSVRPPYVDPHAIYKSGIYYVTKHGSVYLCQCRPGDPWRDAQVRLSRNTELDVNFYTLIPSCCPTTRTIFSIKFLVKSVCRLGDSYHVEHSTFDSSVYASHLMICSAVVIFCCLFLWCMT